MKKLINQIEDVLDRNLKVNAIVGCGHTDQVKLEQYGIHECKEELLNLFESEIAEKDKETEILNARISELNKKTDDLLINIEKLSNKIKQSLNK